MNKQKRLQILIGIAGIGLLFAILVNLSTGKKVKEAPTPGGFYYTGPMKPKGGGNYLATEDGVKSPMPDNLKAKPEPAGKGKAAQGGTSGD
ncbi:MAG: hypothetical protein NT023_25820 [Armatimonadetes bacterium]|nr:hypothetical protein [Armatimonadota bacterium]